MKVRVDIDCTPEEARVFFGLPDVKPMQDAMMSKLQSEMTKRFADMDPEALMKMWFPTGLKGWEDMQKAFWAEFGKGLGAKGGDK